MAAVADLLARKDVTDVYTIEPGATVLEAARRMNEHMIGSLAVLERDSLAGIITERDLLRRVIAEQRDPATTRVRDVMTRDVVTCKTCSSVDDVSSIIKTRRIRHLPVVDADGHVIGMVSLGDLNALAAHERELKIHVMEDYIQGRT